MKVVTIFLAALTLASPAYSQTDEKKPPEEPKFYRLDFLVKEVEGGKVMASRAYTMDVSSAREYNSSSVRTGEKVPVTSASGQFSYVDIGTNIDCHVWRALDNRLILTITADVSSVLGSGNPPVISTNRWNSTATVPIRKPTVIFSADAASSKRQMQLELTVTPNP